MKETRDLNIFEPTDKNKKNLSASSSTPSQENANPSRLQQNPEVDQMFNEMHRMKEDIQQKLGELYEGAGLSMKQVSAYLNNPNNFSAAIWQKMQSQREELKAQVESVLKHYGCQEKAAPVGYIQRISSTSKERKAKTLAGRKKWIPL